MFILRRNTSASYQVVFFRWLLLRLLLRRRCGRWIGLALWFNEEDDEHPDDEDDKEEEDFAFRCTTLVATCL